MIAGFTGTREGLTPTQRQKLKQVLTQLGVKTLHHGDAIGADAQAALAAYQMGARLVCHPPKDRRLRAFTEFNDEMREVKDFHARNRDIVNETKLLIVCPKGMTLEGGGTGYTHDYAGRKRKTRVVVWPDGTCTGLPEGDK